MRKLHATFSNLFHASADSSINTLSLGPSSAKSFLTTCPTQSMWFEHFSKGCLKHMGQEVKQDLAVSTSLMLLLQDILEGEWIANESTCGRIKISMAGGLCFN
jgi:hypothetical protein